jgi:hypothetical protein
MAIIFHQIIGGSIQGVASEADRIFHWRPIMAQCGLKRPAAKFCRAGLCDSVDKPSETCQRSGRLWVISQTIHRQRAAAMFELPPVKNGRESLLFLCLPQFVQSATASSRLKSLSYF